MSLWLKAVLGLVAAMAGVFGWLFGWFRKVAPPEADLHGSVAVVTGSNSGIGRITASALAGTGAHVVLAVRSEARGHSAREEILAEHPTASVEVMRLDVSDLDSVRTFVMQFTSTHDRLDILVNNAGRVIGQREETRAGFEATFATNHLGPFLLTNLLLPTLSRSTPARVVNVASTAHRQGELRFDDLMWTNREYRSLKVYATTKLCNVLFTRELARRTAGTGVSVNCVHPGTIRSGFGQEGDAPRWMKLGMPLARWMFMSPEQGADTSIWLATSPEVADQHGGYFYRRRRWQPSKAARDDVAARQLWERSAELTDLHADVTAP